MAKSIPLGDLARLRRFMGMTTSEHEGEAMNALRMANALLKKHDVTWEEIFDRTVTVGVQPYQPSMPSKHKVYEYHDDGRVEEDTSTDLDRQIKLAFSTLKGKVSGSFAEFVASLEQQYEEKKYLSPKQRKPIFDAARNVMEKR